MIVHNNIEQGTPEWFALRAGIPTASEFSKLVTSTGEPSKSLPGYAITLAGELYAGKPLDSFEGNGYTERGKLLEEEARLAYAFQCDSEPELVGFVTDDAKRYGCSPDAFVGADGMAEIKCLKAENHIKALLYYKRNGKCPPDYVQQTQGQLLVCGRKWVDLYFYHPDLPKLIIRQTPDEAIHKAILAGIDSVIAERDRVFSEISV
jgi:hypothetical protein